ncbi:MAG: RecX family transcriptional regulator [Proteobacteria bacterium]|nr:RecX family transcriptional regulator [Pseudomonadota bacterium]
MKPSGGLSRLQLQARALRWLAQREHSRHELRAKLLRAAAAAAPIAACAHVPAEAEADADADADADAADAEDAADDAAAGRAGSPVGPAEDAQPDADAAAVDALLDRLQAEGLLSDERFVQSRLRVRAGGAGLRRIEAELARHALELPAHDRQALQAGELERAIALWQRRFGGVAAEPKLRARQMRFLAGRGFAADVIRRSAAELQRRAREGG